MARSKLNKTGLPFATSAIGSIGSSLTAEAANARTLSLQLKDENGKDLAVKGFVLCWFSDVNGNTFAAAPAGGVAAGTDGYIMEAIDNRLFVAVSEADGDIDLVITDASGVVTHYLAIGLPDGTVLTTIPIAFA